MPISERAHKLIEKILGMVASFNIDELIELRAAVHFKIEDLESGDQVAVAGDNPAGTIKEQYRRCGKKSCQCHTEGKLHGPYRYQYYRENGRLKSRYLGKLN